MALNNEQLTETYVGINQVLKGLGLKNTDKAELKTKLETIDTQYIKGSSIAQRYQLDRVKRTLNLTLTQVQSVYDEAMTRSANAIKKDLEKARKAKHEAEQDIKQYESELLGKAYKRTEYKA